MALGLTQPICSSSIIRDRSREYPIFSSIFTFVYQKDRNDQVPYVLLVSDKRDQLCCDGSRQDTHAQKRRRQNKRAMNINSLRQSISDIIVAPADRRDRTKTRGGPLAFFRSVDITLVH